MTARSTRVPPPPTVDLPPTTTDLQASALLVGMSPVRQVADFGERLMQSGVVRSREPGKHHTQQCYALIGGRLSSRLRRLGLARATPDGLESTGEAKRLAGRHRSSK